MPRLFTALEIPEDIRDELSALERPLPGANWTDADDYHVTLRFFGDVSDQMAHDLADLLETSAGDAFALRISGLGTLGAEPRLLYAGVEPGPALDAVAHTHDRIARRLGLPKEKHPWKPHITLARLKDADPARLARILAESMHVRFDPVFVHRFVLMSSRPKTGGGPYVEEAFYPLRGGLGAGLDEDGNPW